MLMEVYTSDYKTQNNHSAFDILSLPNNYDDSITDKSSIKSL